MPGYASVSTRCASFCLLIKVTDLGISPVTKQLQSQAHNHQLNQISCSLVQYEGLKSARAAAAPDYTSHMHISSIFKAANFEQCGKH